MLIFVFGQDSYRSKLYLKNLQSAFQQKYLKSRDINWYDMAEDDFAKLQPQLKATSLFDPGKFSVIENAFAHLPQANALANFLKISDLIQNQQKVVVIYERKSQAELRQQHSELFNFLSAHAKQKKEFKPLNRRSVLDWIDRYITQTGFSLDKSAQLALAAICASDLYLLRNELDKTMAYNYAYGRSHIKSADMKVLLEPRFETASDRGDRGADRTLFILADAFFDSNPARFLTNLEQCQRLGKDERRLAYVLAYQARAYLMISEALKDNLGFNSVVQKTKLHPFVVRKLSGFLSDKNSQKARRFLEELPKWEYRVKQEEFLQSFME